MRPNVMILGATGGTGRALVDLLLDHTDAHLLLAARDVGALTRLMASRPHAAERVCTRAFDAGAPAAELAVHFGRADLVVAAAPLTARLPEIVRAALLSGADTLDIQYSPEKVAALRALEGDVVAAGRTVITDGGFHPGLPAVLARAVEERFDVLRSARIGSVIQEDWRKLDISDGSAREFVELIAGMMPAHFVDGQWREEKPTSSGGQATFDFGRPFGERRCYAMALDEMRAWAEGRPGLRRAGFYVGGFNPVVDYALIPLMVVARRLAPTRSTPAMARLLVRGLRTFGRPPYGTLLRLEAEGERKGEMRREVLSVSHASSYALTAMAIAATVVQWLDGTVRLPGVRLQALAVEPHRFLDDLRRFGATVTGLAASHAATPAVEPAPA